MATGGRLRELMKKYGKVALGVHLSVSAASITGLYVAIKNNVDVQSMLERAGLPGIGRPQTPKDQENKEKLYNDDLIVEEEPVLTQKKEKNRTAELAASTGGALAVAILLNKALFPVRVPITLALTPPISRFLGRRNILKNHGIHLTAQSKSRNLHPSLHSLRIPGLSLVLNLHPSLHPSNTVSMFGVWSGTMLFCKVEIETSCPAFSLAQIGH
ncbi:hypothetical protein EJ110_NYTH42165 [Nymphaea thermarum]|nr:hypothetical protein EJ110_NYTH42165 [Nymphaea thermarum]